MLLECSAEPSVLAGFSAGPGYLFATNAVGTLNCLEVARRTQADFVFLSTSRVYPIAALEAIETVESAVRFDIAPEQSLPGLTVAGIAEVFSLEGARSLYGTTKLCSELVIQEYADMYGLRYVINRCGVITGPWQMGKADQGVFALWMGKHYFRRPLKYIGYGGTGKQVRDLISVDDLGSLIEVQLEQFGTLPHRLFNVGGGPVSSLSLAETTNSVAKSREIASRSNLCPRIGWRTSSCISPTTPASPRRQVGRRRKSPRETMSDIFAWITKTKRSLRRCGVADKEPPRVCPSSS